MLLSDDELRYIADSFRKYSWWRYKKIVEKIDDYFAEREHRGSCDHSFETYILKNARCSKCGSTDWTSGESESMEGGGLDNL